MKVIVLWIIVWLVVGIAFAGLITNAYGDYFRTMGVYHNNNPQVCIMNPDPEMDDRLEMISDVTYSAINEWVDKLSANGGNWNVNITEYEWSEHGTATSDDYPNCTVFINYIYGVENDTVGRTGFNFAQSWTYYYWVEIDLNTIEKRISIHLGDSMSSSTVSDGIVWKQLPENDIRNIVLHEFGHALGVEHYYVTTDCRVDECDFSPIMFRSVGVFDGEIKNVTSKDIDMVKRIYGNDGYGGFSPKYIPRECDINAEWYSRLC